MSHEEINMYTFLGLIVLNGMLIMGLIIYSDTCYDFVCKHKLVLPAVFIGIAFLLLR